MDDSRIVDLYLARAEEAVKQSSEKYGIRLKNLAFGITADRMTAEECESDTYLEAWNCIPPNEPRTYLYAFLARITRHIAIDKCRERKALKRDANITELSDELAEILASANNTENEYEAKLLGETISKYLLSLSKEKRLIFTGRYFYLESIHEIASHLFISESKVKTTLFRMRNELRSYLLKEGFDL